MTICRWVNSSARLPRAARQWPEAPAKDTPRGKTAEEGDCARLGVTPSAARGGFRWATSAGRAARAPPQDRRGAGVVTAVEGPNDDVVTVSAWPWSPRVAGDGDGSAARPAAPARLAAASTVPSAVTAPGSADGAVVLRGVELVKDFGGVHAVAGVSIDVRRGTLTGLIGPNGAGKSTLLGMLAGRSIRVTSGQVIYHGTDVTGLPAYRRARLGLVRTFQLASEFKRLTVMENLLSAAPGNRGDSLARALRGRRYWRRDELRRSTARGRCWTGSACPASRTPTAAT